MCRLFLFRIAQINIRARRNGAESSSGERHILWKGRKDGSDNQTISAGRDVHSVDSVQNLLRHGKIINALKPSTVSNIAEAGLGGISQTALGAQIIPTPEEQRK